MTPDTPDITGGNNAAPIAADQLKSIIKRVERLEEDKKAISDDIKEIYLEAKGNGFDVKIIRKIVARRKRDREEVEREQEMIDLYESRIGILG